MPTLIDWILAAIVAVLWPLQQNLVSWPKFQRALRDGVPGARVKGYRETIQHQWVLAAVILVAWLAQGRSLPALGLGWGSGWLAWALVAVALGVVVMMALQTRGIAASRDTRAMVRAKLAGVREVLPHDAHEQTWFRAVSVTAGVCEELMFRGYVTWVIAAVAGPWVAAALTAALFGVAHLYQGLPGILQSSLVGVIMSAVVAAAGSLWPAMLIHAALDWGSGDAARIAIETEGVDALAAGAAAAGSEGAA